jgi:hypothetical protein
MITHISDGIKSSNTKQHYYQAINANHRPGSHDRVPPLKGEILTANLDVCWHLLLDNITVL